MQIELIEKKLEELREIAKRITMRDKHHSPMFFPIMNEKIIYPSTFSFFEQGEKEATQAMLRKTLKDMKEIEAYIFICETYFVTKNADEDCLICSRPSMSPDRQEAILINYSARDGTKRLIFLPFKRAECGQIFFEEEQEMLTEREIILGEFSDLFGVTK